ncbi:OLF49 protein, partial [Caloenas nicobarica]|nr:OLF49 protein [Caloenas nicobarica]
QDELKFGMGPENATAVTEFILEGFSGLDQRLQHFLSLVFLLIYLITVVGNATIILLVRVDHRLQTPMYFFISNLAFLEIWFTSSTSIQLTFCGSNKIHHFFCDSSPLLKLSCSDISLLWKIDSVFFSFVILGSLCLTLAFYMCILFCILHLPAASGRKKAFSTCSSHLITLAILYGSCITLYVCPSEDVFLENNRIVALLNTVLYPFLNPFIYSLRNKPVILALNEVIARTTAQL